MARAFPTDNPFLSHPYYGPVNTEADAAHLLMKESSHIGKIVLLA